MRSNAGDMDDIRAIETDDEMSDELAKESQTDSQSKPQSSTQTNTTHNQTSISQQNNPSRKRRRNQNIQTCSSNIRSSATDNCTSSLYNNNDQLSSEEDIFAQSDTPNDRTKQRRANNTRLNGNQISTSPARTQNIIDILSDSESQLDSDIDITQVVLKSKAVPQRKDSDVIELLDLTVEDNHTIDDSAKKTLAETLEVAKRKAAAFLPADEEELTNQQIIDSLRSRLKCSICLDVIDELTSTKCGHLFDWTCILEQIRLNKCCPICRTKLAKKDIFRVYT